jgi:hypothetical protein
VGSAPGNGDTRRNCFIRLFLGGSALRGVRGMAGGLAGGADKSPPSFAGLGSSYLLRDLEKTRVGRRFLRARLARGNLKRAKPQAKALSP